MDIDNDYADDDENDFACFSVKGKLSRIAARCGHQVIAFREWAHVSTSPADAEEGTMHQIASRQFELFTGQPASAIGLVSFDSLQN
jgi:hypothetical protein